MDFPSMPPTPSYRCRDICIRPWYLAMLASNGRSACWYMRSSTTHHTCRPLLCSGYYNSLVSNPIVTPGTTTRIVNSCIITPGLKTKHVWADISSIFMAVWPIFTTIFSTIFLPNSRPCGRMDKALDYEPEVGGSIHVRGSFIFTFFG